MDLKSDMQCQRQFGGILEQTIIIVIKVYDIYIYIYIFKDSKVYNFLEVILVKGSIGTGQSYLVKYLAENSYVPFVTIFLNQFLDNMPKRFLIDDSDDIDRDLHMELELLVGKFGFVSDTKHIAEATIMDLLHS